MKPALAKLANDSIALLAAVVLAVAAALVLAGISAAEMFGGYVALWPVRCTKPTPTKVTHQDIMHAIVIGQRQQTANPIWN